uniref:Unplaced genomic scaffold supercont1.12, whole genome shotgun sequence n=1 Tax=Cryptococcus bacillisporus CA1280 TaxID=1296109 RepID=A0A0D0TIV8_CRYGA|nr:hypothetical protein I312_04493 [Cryptococcus bacillisporus CA1280]
MSRRYARISTSGIWNQSFRTKQTSTCHIPDLPSDSNKPTTHLWSRFFSSYPSPGQRWKTSVRKSFSYCPAHGQRSQLGPTVQPFAPERERDDDCHLDCWKYILGCIVVTFACYPARSAYVPPSAPEIVQPVSQPIREIIESPEEEGPLLMTMAEELDNLSGFNSFRPLNPLKTQHFQTSSALVCALGEHLPRAFCDIGELRNKEEWMLSILRTTSTIMTTYNNALLDMASEINDLRSQVTELKEKVGTGNGGLERKRARKKVRTETDRNVLVRTLNNPGSDVTLLQE